jgi:hypothetical protein
MNADMSFMKIVSESEELDIFNTDSINDIIDFKWDSFGRSHHMVGCMNHLA